MGCLRGRGTGQGEGRRGRGSDGFTAEGELAAPRCQPGTQEHPGQTRWERHHVGQAQARSPPGPQLHPWGVVRHLWWGCSRRTEERTRRMDERWERPEGNVQKFSYSQGACVFLPFLLGKILSCFFKQKAHTASAPCPGLVGRWAGSYRCSQQAGPRSCTAQSRGRRGQTDRCVWLLKQAGQCHGSTGQAGWTAGVQEWTEQAPQAWGRGPLLRPCSLPPSPPEV